MMNNSNRQRTTTIHCAYNNTAYINTKPDFLNLKYQYTLSQKGFFEESLGFNLLKSLNLRPKYKLILEKQRFH
jgi:hypothetical protein